MRHTDTERKPSTVIRDDTVLGIYKELQDEMGKYAAYVSKSYIYERIKDRTGLCHKTIAFILNHIRPQT